ncbi:MAG: hypothetical protein SH868_06440 [Bythopirellula sp.]|nr:hypothetical protein [Bythopirellula sp.]
MGSRFRALQGALLSLASCGLSIDFTCGSEPANPWRNKPEVSQPTEHVLVSDLDDQIEVEKFSYDFEFETDADLNFAQPTQFQSGRGMAGSRVGRTAATPASLGGTGQRTPQSFTVRLARAPNMIGDFFGQGSTEITVQTPSSVQSFSSFLGEVDYAPSGEIPGGSTVQIVPIANLGDFAQFAVTGAFLPGDAQGIAFTSIETVDQLNANGDTTFGLVVTAAQGSTISDTQAQANYQAAANAYLNDPTSDPQNFLNAQQAAIIAQQGHGIFTAIPMQNNTIAFDDAEATFTTQPNTSGPSNPSPGGGISVDNSDISTNLAPGETYLLSSKYLASFGDQLFTPDPITLLLPSPAAGDIVGRVRIQDNNSPLPKDRVFFDYNFFHNVPFTSTGTDVNRFAPGVEKTFWDQQASVEVRVPMALTLDNAVLTDGLTDSSSSEFGNLACAVKFLLTSTETTAVAAGLGVSAPTADDLEVSMADGTQLVRVTNDSTHVLPYLAVLCTPENSNWYVQSFLTFDFDTTGSDVFANVSGMGLEEIGVWNDQHLATLSVATGSWFYQNYAPGNTIRRIGWQAEAHYTETLNDADSVASGNFRVGNPDSELSLVNGIFGLNVHVGKTIITTGYTVPLTDDKVFDGEVRAFVNRYF